jgi:hypothetical protein
VELSSVSGVDVGFFSELTLLTVLTPRSFQEPAKPECLDSFEVTCYLSELREVSVILHQALNTVRRPTGIHRGAFCV